MKRAKPRRGWGSGWGYHMRKWSPRTSGLTLWWTAQEGTIAGRPLVTVPALLGDAPVARETTRKVPKGEPK